jgi:hypothetical protein
MNVRGWSLRRLAAVAMLAYGGAGVIVSLPELSKLTGEGLGGLVGVLALFVLVVGGLFLVLGFLVLRRWLGRVPLAAGALMSAGLAWWFINLPTLQLVPIVMSLAVAVVSVAAVFDQMNDDAGRSRDPPSSDG